MYTAAFHQWVIKVLYCQINKHGYSEIKVRRHGMYSLYNTCPVGATCLHTLKDALFYSPVFQLLFPGFVFEGCTESVLDKMVCDGNISL